MTNQFGITHSWIHLVVLLTLALPGTAIAGALPSLTEGLVAYYPLRGDTADHSGKGHDGKPKGGVSFAENTTGPVPGYARFDGIDGAIEVTADPELDLGGSDFTLAGWYEIPSKVDDLYGTLISKFDTTVHAGFHLTLQHSPGVTTSQPNTRNLFFGLDSGGTDFEWKDCGRPGNAVLVYSLAVFEGNLYAGTYEEGKGEAGTVYRYDGDGTWTSCGSPDTCNSVTSLCVFQGKLYAAVSRYQADGSRLAISENKIEGGKVYRYEGGTEWTDCGRLGKAEYIFGMTEFDNHLYATLIHSPNPTGDLSELGLYRYEGEKDWTFLGNPGGRPVSLAPYNGNLYATGYDGGELGGVFRFNRDNTWTNIGVPGNTSQTYSFAFYEGRMYVGTWPDGKVYRYRADGDWEDVGRLGGEQEVMGMSVYNGSLFAGTLPLAEVYRYDGGESWTRTGRLDLTPGDMYRRAWSMAVFKGELFCGVLPSGKVHSLQTGETVSFDSDLGTGWKHLAAVRSEGMLFLYVNGERVASSPKTSSNDSASGNLAPLRLGYGPHEFFKGGMAEVRLYNRALDAEEIQEISKTSQ